MYYYFKYWFQIIIIRHIIVDEYFLSTCINYYCGVNVYVKYTTHIKILYRLSHGNLFVEQ